MTYPEADFTYDKWESRPMIPVSLQDSNGNWQTHEFLVDSGNDTTIVTSSTAASLGWQDTGHYSQVVGISGKPQTFFIRENTMIRIGDTHPVSITVVVGDTDMNLLGRRDVFDNFEVTFTPQGAIRLVQRSSCSFCV